eukprot:CAMPEP_0197911574 /NCGR_PEP_ID=MMETSP1439-20131203/73079_1 /TAXON_ID=66791 /ORGANISM="Gonyaulax spinifera, Strain CCMP409" /LENGTH=233 /DNA_ID=CAMNT_0043533309 /DNA_START=50 /DNA_END=751 /DNA_ORIENTATION=+
MGACQMTTPKHKLVYFDIRGVAETARFLFAIAKVPYKDVRFSLTFGTPGDFSTIKRPEFDAAKAKGELDVSLGKVPYLEVDGVKIGQSKAIERFLAGEFGMLGASPMEAGLIDMLCETIRDCKDAYQKAKSTKDEDEKKKALEKWFAEDMPGHLKTAEKSLPAGKGPWLVGSKVSLADVAWFSFVAAPNGYFDNSEGAKAAYQDCPRIKAAVEAVAKIPQLTDWIAERPDSPF